MRVSTVILRCMRPQLLSLQCTKVWEEKGGVGGCRFIIGADDIVY